MNLLEQRVASTVASVCDSIDSGAHGVMFQIRAKHELQVEALWIASAWVGTYGSEVYCTEPHGDIPWQPPPFPSPTKPLAELVPYEIDGWLDSISLPMYKTKFRQQKVTGSELIMCASGEKKHQHDSLTSLGVLFVGHRETLLAHIKAYAESGVPMTEFGDPGALMEAHDELMGSSTDERVDPYTRWKHCGFATLKEPKRLTKVLLAHKQTVPAGFTQAFYIHTKDGYGSGIGFRQGRDLPFTSGESDHVQVLRACVSRSEVPFEKVTEFDLLSARACMCAFAGRVDYSIKEAIQRKDSTLEEFT